MNRFLLMGLSGLIMLSSCKSGKETATDKGGMSRVRVSDNRRFFVKENGDPFFWLGDTGWLLFGKTTREEAGKYLDDRKQKGFNVIQVMMLHELKVVNVYGDSALHNRNIATPDTTAGKDFSDSLQYDFWDHMDYVVDLAAEKNIYMALVPVWGGNVKSGRISVAQANAYATFIAERYRNRPNIIWLNGGDIKGSDSTAVWNMIGSTLQSVDTNHLVTFHPFGRTQSSTWFHDAPWIDFHMCQSGHRSYAQDTAPGAFAEDNWKFIQADYNDPLVRPTLDGEPSYEGIPHGLHDSTQPRWTAADVRRYGYWSVFAGAAGYTYGNNSVMQFLRPGDTEVSFGARDKWYDAIKDPGAGQMKYLKNLILSHSYFDRVPDQSLIADQGERYDYLAASRGKDFALIYTYNGRNFKVNMDKVPGGKAKAIWYSPVDGSKKELQIYKNEGVREFDPPGDKTDGNDWVLIFESK